MTDVSMTDNDIEQQTDFDWLANFYSSQGAINHPSELHGLLVGRLAGSERLDAEEWVTLVVEHMGLDQLKHTEESEQTLTNLYKLYDKNVQQLEEIDMAFQPVLPDDDFILNQRVEALGVWVRGFLEGLALATKGELANSDADTQELLRDMVAISQIDDQIDDSEEAEKEINEIIEYVRVGVVTLFAEFNGVHDADDDAEENKTIH